MQEIKPQLADVFLTPHRPSSLLLRVAHVKLIDAKYDRQYQTKKRSGSDAPQFNPKRRYARKFVLTDGELWVQALLHSKLIREGGDAIVGDQLYINKYEIKEAPKLNGQGNTRYLAILDCYFLLQPAPPSPEVKQTEQENLEVESKKRQREPQEHTELCEPGNKKEETIVGGLFPSSPPAKRLKSSTIELAASTKEGYINTETREKTDQLLVEAAVPVTRFEKMHEEMPVPFSEAFDTRSGSIGSSKAPAAIVKSKQRLGRVDNVPKVPIEDEDEDTNSFEEADINLATVRSRREALQSFDSDASVPQSPSKQIPSIKPTTTKATVKSPSNQPPEHSPYVLESISQMIERDLREEVEKKERERYRPPPPNPRPEGAFWLSQLPAPLPQQQRGITVPQAEHITPKLPPQPIKQTLLPAPPIYTLDILRNPLPNQRLPSKNFIVTILACISWTGTSLIHQSGSMFPPKRHLKIVDPSLTSSRPPSRNNQSLQQTSSSTFTAQNAFQGAVTVAVYIDAADFRPVAGTVALFRGLVMNRLGNGDIILNAYARLTEQRFEEGPLLPGMVPSDAPTVADTRFDTHWFITDEKKIRALGFGSKYDYYQEWWAEKQQSRQSARP